MESLRGHPHPPPPPRLPTLQTRPDTNIIKRNLLKKGVTPTPKIIHNLRKKQLQKLNRKSDQTTISQQQRILEEEQEEEAHFQTLEAEYQSFNRAIAQFKRSKQDNHNTLDDGVVSSSLVGKPWERLQKAELREFSSANQEHVGRKNLKYEHLDELSVFIEKERDKFKWILDNDIELEDGLLEKQTDKWVPPKRSDDQAIRFLVDRLGDMEPSTKNWKFSKTMKQSGMQFTESQLLKTVDKLGDKGQWRHALSVVEWVYNSKEHKHFKSRFVYTKLLAVLGKARRPHEALQIFNLMRADCHLYPDMAAYHCVAVALGRGGLLKELVNVIDCMKQKPSKIISRTRRKNWDPVLQPDLVIYNAVLNACTLSGQWKGVSWVFKQLRGSGLRPTEATYGLAMEVMVKSGKFDLVHQYFEKMKKSGHAPKALTYKVLVKAFREEGRVREAIDAVRDMEQRGVIGAASVYCELAFCLCYYGMWKEAMLEIDKMKRLPLTKPLVVAFTSMIFSSMDGGHIDNCILIFQHSKEHCAPNIGIINAMLKVYGRNDMFFEAKELYEDTERSYRETISSGRDGPLVSPDAYTYHEMLRASASAQQWEYFDYVYKEMVINGYQLDRGKHAFLLVEASRAGKFHLLEHAFDALLEAGEIPPSSFFIEIICQAIIQLDFERAARVLNSMAHAPFEISEKEWRGLFKEYKGMISESHLQRLFDKIAYGNVTVEASVSNLSRLLQSLCGSKSNNSHLIALSGKTSCQGLYENNIVNSIPHDMDVEEDDPDLESSSKIRSDSFDTNGRGKLHSKVERYVDELIPDESVKDCHGKSSKTPKYSDLDVGYDSKNNMLRGELDEPDRRKLPSADEILDNWKEVWMKDETGWMKHDKFYLSRFPD